ncbi:MAG TPA: cation-translocating P-type ATPase [Verrucomicrobiae bacterium]|nr:cation-translocating P-type ATPase [Verrucomicrobiae bacterium]
MHAHLEENPAADAAESSVAEFTVTGMNCANCVRHVTEAIQAVAGVASATVRLEEGRATVRWKTDAVPASDRIVMAIKEAGYEATPVGEANGHADASATSPMAAWKFTLIFGAVLTLPLVLGEWLFGLGMKEWFKWIGFSLAAPVMVVCGGRFFKGAWLQLRRGSSNMDTLVALGSSTAFGYSTAALLLGWHGHTYFMEAAAIITLISAGHYMEAVVSARATSSLRALMNLAPQTTRKLDDHGNETETPVASLRVGDKVVLKPGDRIPTDGEVIEGNSAVDESMLTGESLPVDKAADARLYSGTANQNGRLVMRVTATGEATALAQIIAVVQRAQSSRANIQKLGDKVSSVFVPVVVVVAIGTALWWGLAYENALRVGKGLESYLWTVHFPMTALAAAFIHAAGVLIVACPCAMGLATPAAIMAGTNVAARRGILIRDGVALEKSGTITAVVFDKTGTLTQGKPGVEAIEDLRPSGERRFQLKQLASALAAPSNHPLSQAVTAVHERRPSNAPDSAGGHRPPLQDWQELRGKGVQARLHGTLFRLGSLNWLGESGVDSLPAPHSVPSNEPAHGSAGVPPASSPGVSPGHRFMGHAQVREEHEALHDEASRHSDAPDREASGIGSATDKFTKEWAARGATILGLAADRKLIGLLALRDTIKPHASDVVAVLKQQRKTTYLITGDNQPTAVAIAQQVGIPRENVFAEIRPEQKAGIVKQLQERGERIAFVGDGINDAPALEQADLGIAVAKASDVAREAADIILLKSDIQAIPEALGLAQATLRTIKQNLFWAFFYNAAAVPLAVLGFLSPVLCAAAMGLSDLIVIGNALRLRRWKETSR